MITERLEKLFELYTKMTADVQAKPATKAARGKKALENWENWGHSLYFPIKPESVPSLS